MKAEIAANMCCDWLFSSVVRPPGQYFPIGDASREIPVHWQCFYASSGFHAHEAGENQAPIDFVMD